MTLRARWRVSNWRVSKKKSFLLLKQVRLYQRQKLPMKEVFLKFMRPRIPL